MVSVKPVLGDWEIPRIAHMQTLESRDFVELPVPGRVGSLFQDLNTAPTRLWIAGSLYGDEARNEFLETLREKYHAGEAVTFVADIVNATQVQYVLIETLRFREDAHQPDVTAFEMVLRESPPPPPPLDPLAGLDAGLPELGLDFLDSLSGLMDALDGLGNIPDISDPTPALTGALDGVKGATEGLDEALTPLRDIFGDGQ